MTPLAKSLHFEDEELDDLADSPYGSRNAFPLLALMNSGIDLRQSFHLDHIFARKQLSTGRLRRSGPDRRPDC